MKKLGLKSRCTDKKRSSRSNLKSRTCFLRRDLLACHHPPGRASLHDSSLEFKAPASVSISLSEG